MAGYVPDVDAFSMLSGIGDTLQKNNDRKEAGPLSIDLARAAAGLPPLNQAAPQQPGIFGQIVNGAKNIFAPQPQAVAPTPVVNQRPVSSSTNIPSDYLQKTAQIESGGDPNATNPSGASGLFQFTPGTAKQYGLLNADGSVNNDPQAQTVAATKLAQDNATSLSQTLGRAPTGAELYLAHQQGAGGASALLANPSQGAVDALTPVYGSAQKAAAAITQNGGDPNMTAGQFASLWTNKYNGAGGQSQPGQQQPAMAFAGGTPAPSANPNASQQPTASPALPMAPQGVPSVGSAQTPMGQQIPPLSPEALSRALTNPYTKDLAQGLLTKYAQPNTIQTIGNTVYSVNARTNTLTPLMQVPKEPTVQELPVTGADGTMTGTQKYWVSPDKPPVPLGGVDTSKMKTQFTPMTPEEAQTAGFDTKVTGPVYKDENGKPYLPAKPNSSVVFGQEGAADKAIGEAKGKVVADAITAGATAGPRLRSLAEMNDAVQSGGNDISTGPLAEAIKGGKQFLSNIAGVSIAGLPQSEVVQKVGFGLATQLTKAISVRPAQSEFLKSLENVPGLFQSKPGMQALISINTQEAQADRDLSRLAMKTKADDWGDVRDAYYAAHPLISPFTGKPFGEADIPIVTGNSGTVVPSPNGNAPMAQPQARQPLPQGYSAASAVAEGRAAIAAGKDPAAVAARLQSYGIDPKNLSAQ